VSSKDPVPSLEILSSAYSSSWKLPIVFFISLTKGLTPRFLIGSFLMISISLVNLYPELFFSHFFDCLSVFSGISLSFLRSIIIFNPFL
jgi:hypothetical protein